VTSKRAHSIAIKLKGGELLGGLLSTLNGASSKARNQYGVRRRKDGHQNEGGGIVRRTTKDGWLVASSGGLVTRFGDQVR